jgi:replication factor C small subunit
LIVKNIQCDYLYINASDENGIDTIRERVKGFASTASFQPIKIVILDEADFLTQPAQAALRNLIEEYSAYTRFILTCNYVERLIEPLQSRCELHMLKPPTKGAVAKHVCTNILEVEGVTYDVQDVVTIVNLFYPDVRSIIKTLQQNVKDSKLTITTIDDNWCKPLVEILKKRDKNAWYQVRQLVADSQVDDFQTAYRYMFDNLVEFSYGHDAELSVILDDFIWRAGVVPDKEINFAACIAKILETNKKQVL